MTTYPNDLPATSATSGRVLVGGSVTSQIETTFDRDWFKVSLVAGKSYRFDLEGAGGLGELSDPYLRLYRNGTLIELDDDGGAGLDSRIEFTAIQTGTYFLAAGAYSTATGTYRLSVEEYTPPPAGSLLPTIDWGTQLASNQVDVYFATSGESHAGYESLQWTAYEIRQVMAVMDEIEQSVGLTFNRVTSPANAEFKLVIQDNALSGFAGLMYPPGQTNAGVGVFNRDAPGWDSAPGGGLEKGGTGFQLLLHEFGHGLGLAHPHDDGGTSARLDGVTSSRGDYGNFDLNQGVFTNLSYNDGRPAVDGSAPETYGATGTYSPLDIAVLQQKYGATTANTGANTYVLPGGNGAGTYYSAIWDTGGRDAVVYNGTRAATIDLREATLFSETGGGGFVSSASGIRGGFTIANGVRIEDARGGGGADLITGNRFANELTGNAGDDRLFGGNGNDKLIGNAGNDSLLGQVGNDFLSGGAGQDRLFGASGDDTLTGGNDSDILNGGTGRDLLRGDRGTDTLIGGDDNDRLFGGGENDSLDGGNGNDTLDGGAGIDVLAGGIGNDLYIVDNARDSITESGSGFDTVRASVSYDLDGSNAERLELIGTGNINGTGDNFDNEIIGTSGVNVLRGRGGDDSISAGSGNDRVFGDAGVDSLFGGAGNDLLSGGSGSDILHGEADADTLIGGDGNDRLLGGESNDSLSGGVGNDTLDGGTGIDVLAGGLGQDTYLVDHSRDTVTDTGTDFDTVLSTADFDLAASGVERLELVGSADIDGTGNQLDNQIIGAGGANILRGREGDDYLSAAGGDDRLFGDAGEDRVIGGAGDDFLNGGAGSDSLSGDRGSDTLLGSYGEDILSGGDSDDRLFGGGGLDTLYGGEGNDYLSGGLASDTLHGDEGADTLTGNEGNDILFGGTGADRLIGGTGEDRLDGGIGADVMVGGQGNDTYLIDNILDSIIDTSGALDRALSTVSFNLSGSNVERLQLVSTADTDGTGNQLDNHIIGNRGENVLHGRDGDDFLSAASGDDRVYGDAGDDRVIGGAGDDLLNGGSGADILVFRQNYDSDIVVGFEDDIDTLELSEGLWGGGLTVSEMLDNFASAVGASVVFDFGNGDILRVSNITLSALEDDIAFV